MRLEKIETHISGKQQDELVTLDPQFRFGEAQSHLDAEGPALFDQSTPTF